MDPETGWVKAEEENGNPRIPTGVFEYFIRHQDPVVEGTALVAFLREARGMEQPRAGRTYLVGGENGKNKHRRSDASVHATDMLSLGACKDR